MKAKKLPSGKWSARGYNKNIGKQKMFTADSKKEAERLAREYQYEASKNATNEATNEMTFGEAYALYLDANKKSWVESTLAERERWKETKYKDLLEMPLSDITDVYLQIYIDEMAKTHSAKTVKNVVTPIRTIVRRYSKRIVDIQLPKIRKPKLDLPSETTIQMLLKAVEGDAKFCVPVYLATFGCMRRGEIAALDDAHIDMDKHTIFIEFSKAQKADRTWYLKVPKNGESRRITAPSVIFDKIKKYGLPKIDNPDDFSNQFGKFIKRNNIPHLRFHDLRHYCAARMLSLPATGETFPLSISFVAEYGGWLDKTVLMKIYDYVIDEVREASVACWNNFADSTSNKLVTKSANP